MERYKGRVTHWEIWNEPDTPTYWTPQDDMVRYTALLKKVYCRAKKIDPDCRILNGGLSEGITFSLKNIYKNGGKGFFDILAIHPFVNPLRADGAARVKTMVAACRKIIKERGDAKEIWLTELGAPGVKTPKKENGWREGMSPTEKEQANWVRRIYAEILPALPPGTKIFWAFSGIVTGTLAAVSMRSASSAGIFPRNRALTLIGQQFAEGGIKWMFWNILNRGWRRRSALWM